MKNTIEKLEINFPIGTEVIIITNEPNRNSKNVNDIIIGTVVDYEDYGHSAFVVYSENTTNAEYVSMTDPLYYSKELEQALNKLDWYERWNIYSRGLSIITKETAQRKEKQ